MNAFIMKTHPKTMQKHQETPLSYIAPIQLQSSLGLAGPSPLSPLASSLSSSGASREIGGRLALRGLAVDTVAGRKHLLGTGEHRQCHQEKFASEPSL